MVNGTDLKSVGPWPRRFESCPVHYELFYCAWLLLIPTTKTTSYIFYYWTTTCLFKTLLCTAGANMPHMTIESSQIDDKMCEIHRHGVPQKLHLKSLCIFIHKLREWSNMTPWSILSLSSVSNSILIHFVLPRKSIRYWNK